MSNLVWKDANDVECDHTSLNLSSTFLAAIEKLCKNYLNRSNERGEGLKILIIEFAKNSFIMN